MHLLMTTDTVGGVWTFTSTLTEQLLKRGTCTFTSSASAASPPLTKPPP